MRSTRRKCLTPSPLPSMRCHGQSCHIHSVVGSKPFKQFMSPSSVEDSANGIVWMRRRTCMQCEGCRNALRLSDFEACKYMEECGPVQQIQLVKKNCAPPTRITRSFLRDAGVKLGKGLRIGDLVVIELLNDSNHHQNSIIIKKLIIIKI